MEEMVDIVDEKDKVISTTTKREMVENALLHRAARVVLLNSKGEVLVQKRSEKKKVYPGCWDIGVAETVQSGESFEEAATRGLNEEMGVSDVIGDFLFKTKFLSKDNNVIYKVFEAFYDGDVKVQEEEVDEARFVPLDGAISIANLEKFSPTGKFILDKYVEMKR
ncbi:NUDIX domain-containing protein [Candidatus Woesearchaeota archaeon]|nr:NUDIX domain-containing protein [Candidatus Woesearchaeota archaeon]